MKKLFTLLVLTSGLNFGLKAQPGFQWAQQIGGTSGDVGNSIAVDASGNVYTTGYFQGTADFDPGAGIYNLTSAGSYDIFVCKLDASGNFAWAIRIGGASADVGNSVTVDGNGNVFVTGYFVGTVDFDPGPGTFNLTGTNGDIFICKLNTSGNFVWAKRMGGAGNEYGYSIALDVTGNVYTVGQFTATVDFDPGPGIYNMTPKGYDIFVSKLDISGNFLWAKQFSGTTVTCYNYGASIAVDAAGNVYTTGYFLESVDLDPGTGTFYLTSAGKYDVFISKLDSLGNFVWAKRIGGTLYDDGTSIAVDASGNVYVAGLFSDTIDFTPSTGTVTLTSKAGYDIFIFKLDASGDVIWNKQLGGNSTDFGRAMTVDASGNVYITGSFQGIADFDPGPGTYNFTKIGGIDIFVCKLDSLGNFVWAEQLGGTSSEEGFSIAVDAAGNVYTTGYFKGTGDFDPGSGIYNLTSAGSADIFVHKMSLCSGSGLAITAVRDTICAGTPGILNVTNNPGSIQWQSSVTAGIFKNISGATIGNYVSQDTISTYFRVYSSSASCADTSSAFALIVKQSPVADFLSSGTGTQISFTDKSKGATVYNWDFGDIKTSTEQNPVHTYSSKGTYHVCLTVLNGSNCSFTICRDIDVDVTTEVKNINAANKIIVSPNPFSNTITIEQTHANNPIQSIEVYDLLGKKVYEQIQISSSKPEAEINLSSLANSMYFVKVKTNDTDYLERIIKQ